jgi:UDP-glucose 4-epimerase
MVKAVVTGGCGFIGSTLVENLEKGGHSITVFDDLSLGTTRNIAGLKVENHILSCAHIKSFVSDCDGIFHLGIPSSSPMYKEKPELVGETITNAIKIFEYAKHAGSKVVYASTSSVYNGNQTPYREDMSIYARDYYSECRYAIERLAKVYNLLHGVKSVGLRFFSVYGPKENHKGRYANIVSQFLWRMRRDERPVIYGDGKQTRDFIHVSDVVEALMCAMQKKIDLGVFNVGTGVAHSFNDVVTLLNDALGKGIKPVYQPNPIKNYVQHTLADPSLAEKALGFKAKTALSKGISLYS